MLLGTFHLKNIRSSYSTHLHGQVYTPSCLQNLRQDNACDWDG